MRLYDYAASGNCFKIRLLLALLGRDYERVPVDIFAGDTGLEHPPHVAAWLERIRVLPGFVDDFLTYPDNARPGVSRSIYDSMS